MSLAWETLSNTYIHTYIAHMKICSATLVVGEVQIKTMMRRHFTPTRMVTIKKTDKC